MIASNFIARPVRYEKLGMFSLLLLIALMQRLSSYGLPSNKCTYYHRLYITHPGLEMDHVRSIA